MARSFGDEYIVSAVRKIRGDRARAPAAASNAATPEGREIAEDVGLFIDCFNLVIFRRIPIAGMPKKRCQIRIQWPLIRIRPA